MLFTPKLIKYHLIMAKKWWIKVFFCSFAFDNDFVLELFFMRNFFCLGKSVPS